MTNGDDTRTNVLPFRPRPQVDGPSAEALAELERRVRHWFSSAIGTALDLTWEQVQRPELASMDVDTFVLMVNRVIKEETSRFPIPPKANGEERP